MTSSNAVVDVRRLLCEKSVGHAGTLDPGAAGVLPVCVGKATRLFSYLTEKEKEYRAEITFGIATDTLDAYGKIVQRAETCVTKEQLLGVLPGFLGEQVQLPPMYSAVKLEGKKLYELARKGIETERPARPVTIHALTARQDAEGFLLDVTCSKGTYIRTLCHDIGQALGCGAVMSALRRTRVGPFTLEDAVTLEAVEQAARAGSAESLIRPVDTLFSSLPAITVTDNQKKRCLSGSPFPVDAEEGLYRVYDKGRNFLMLGRVEKGTMKTVRGFFEV